MGVTLAYGSPARPKVTGRPSGSASPLVAAGEAVVEALVVVQDDRQAIGFAIQHLRVGRRILSEIEAHLNERIERIANGEVEIRRLSTRVETAIASRSQS